MYSVSAIKSFQKIISILKCRRHGVLNNVLASTHQLKHCFRVDVKVPCWKCSIYNSSKNKCGYRDRFRSRSRKGSRKGRTERESNPCFVVPTFHVQYSGVGHFFAISGFPLPTPRAVRFFIDQHRDGDTPVAIELAQLTTLRRRIHICLRGFGFVSCRAPEENVKEIYSYLFTFSAHPHGRYIFIKFSSFKDSKP